MIKAVIFDCFGVLTTDGWLAFSEHYLAKDPELSERGMIANKKVDAGLISYENFIHEIASLASMSAKETRLIIENNVSNYRIFEYIRDELKPRYKIGMLSNASGNWLNRMFDDRQIALFDATVFSYEVGAIKPDSIMYETIAAKLGVLPKEAVYIDDQLRYVEGARVVGMQGIHFTSTFETITKIGECLSA